MVSRLNILNIFFFSQFWVAEFVPVWSFELGPRMIAGEPQESDLRFDEVHG
jgi:hypothetical protein